MLLHQQKNRYEQIKRSIFFNKYDYFGKKKNERKNFKHTTFTIHHQRDISQQIASGFFQ